MIDPPINFGIYLISPKFLDSYQDFYSDLNTGLLKPNRPFVCVYVDTKYGKKPYFVPLYSINPKDIKNYKNKKNKWLTFEQYEKNQSVKTLLIFDDPINKKIKDFKSVAVLYKAIPVPIDMVYPMRRNGHTLTITSDISSKLRVLTQRYINATQTSKTHPKIKLNGFLKALYYEQRQKNFASYPVNHCLLLDVIKEKESRKAKYKNKKQNHKSEEKEK